ncbi:cytochrome c, somatic-like [Diadema antillarum]|uniref:cytochrome c, somatic-like n=1 Tax=Diadema antillarum TaxID=105358 RepID=UPI003A8AD3CB
MGNKQGYQRMAAQSDDLSAKGDPDKGALIFQEHCAGCHDIDKSGEHRAGPNLMGLWGREASTVPDFAFVESDEKRGIVWKDDTLFEYFEKPHIPGTKFLFRDLKGKAEDKANLIAYLKRESNPGNS